MSKSTNFPKRMDIWRTYRDEINKTSLKLGSPFSSDKRLSRLVGQINAISPTILKNVSNDLELSETITIQSTSIDRYKSLSFDFNSLDKNLLDKISDGIANAELEQTKYFLINANGTLSTDSLQKFKQKDDALASIEKSIKAIEYRIQKFPQTATEDLAALNTVLETIKIKLKDELVLAKLDTTKINKTSDWKKVYRTSMWILIFSLIGITVFTVLLFVL